jgi:hypothetical protein
MSINLSKLSTKDIATATAAMEAAWRIHKEREHCEMEDQRRWQEAEHAHQEAEEWARQEAVVRREAEADEERCQSLAAKLSGLMFTIPAPSTIASMVSGSSTQSKGKRKVTEETLFLSL